MKKLLSKLALGFVLLLAPMAVNAHNIWLEVKGSGKINDKVQVQLYFGEYGQEAPEKGAKLDRLKDIKIFLIDASGTKSEIAMAQTETHWQGSFDAKTAGTYQIIGINDQGEVRDMSKKHLGFARSISYLKAVYTVKTPEAKEYAVHPLDLTAQKQNDSYLLTAFKDKKQQGALNITIINPEGWVKTVETNEKGQAAFVPNKKGLYLINLEWIDNTKGSFKDKVFENTVNKSVLSLKVE
ncbi:hypothetical protein [Flavobacterium aquicola]|uniref:Putative GH25 family protein n=1 Tax=Flavobacterium aquicola TaxID=1682742 RepID=A0A3E0EJR6_9FLAO|nr:hypothetical protein [Flavobacterium aquicola]REG98421.1 putative GH25 family protein [Flavobacterium aquicola]